MVQRLSPALIIAALVPMLLAQVARANSTDEKSDSKKKDAATIAVFRLHGKITESPQDEDFFFGSGRQVSLKDMVSRLKKAAEDKNVKAVVFLAEGEAPGSAQIEELRQAMAQIRSAGKEIYVHADSLSMRDYVLLAGASRISVVPTGDVWITGLYGETPFVRGLLDKIGVKPEFLTCGKYKSAAEIFMRESPSPEAEQMQNWLFDSLYNTDVNLIATGRAVEQSRVKAWIDGGPYIADKAKQVGLIDAVEERQDFSAMLKKKYGKDVVFNHKYGSKKQPDLDFSSPFAMFKIWADLLGDAKKADKKKSAIGIVYVDGAISLGAGEASPFGAVSGGAYSSSIRKALDEAARTDSIKAVVLRVDSPGGSAVASDIILDATKRVKAKKPFVVSMGDVAGSGGYYVACGSDVIFADKATITGSIGVVSGKFVTNPMWKKIGITFHAYQRGANAGILTSARPFTKEERERMQGWMDDIYGVFKQHVKEIRGTRLKKPIDDLAGGRVYTGEQALELGLVDKIGTLEDAIKYVAAQAKLTDYDVRVVPEPKNFVERLIEEASGGKEDSHRLSLGSRVSAGPAPASLVDLALPHLQHLDPQRVRVVKMALARLQLMQQEGVIMMMPEMLLGR
jgi:protease IV